jgi:hypothetical protein
MARGQRQSELQDRLNKVGKRRPELGKALKSFKPNLRRALLSTSFADVVGTTPTKEVLARLQTVVRDLTADKGVITFGLWDLNAMIGGLEHLLEKLNGTQKKIAFFRIVAAIPAGLISDRERIRSWLKEQKQDLTRSDVSEIEENTIFEDFYPQAEKVRVEMGLDYLAGITQSKVAFHEGRHIYWNYFTAALDMQRGLNVERCMLLSSYGLRKYAARAGRPFNVAVAYIAISQLLATISPDVDYHADNRGCMFDFNEDRDSIVESIRQAMVEPACLKKIQRGFRETATTLLDTLRGERVESSPPR